MSVSLYKGAAPGTFWSDPKNDPRTTGGFRAPYSAAITHHVVTRHVARPLSAKSPLISFSTSYAIAQYYAQSGPGGFASPATPGFVFEIDLDQLPSKSRPKVIDPVAYISSNQNGFYAHSHNGTGLLIAEIASGNTSFTHAMQCGGNMIQPAVSPELIALINAIRDAELLVEGSIPASAIVQRHEITA